MDRKVSRRLRDHCPDGQRPPPASTVRSFTFPCRAHPVRDGRHALCRIVGISRSATRAGRASTSPARIRIPTARRSSAVRPSRPSAGAGGNPTSAGGDPTSTDDDPARTGGDPTSTGSGPGRSVRSSRLTTQVPQAVPRIRQVVQSINIAVVLSTADPTRAARSCRTLRTPTDNFGGRLSRAGPAGRARARSTPRPSARRWPLAGRWTPRPRGGRAARHPRAGG